MINFMNKMKEAKWTCLLVIIVITFFGFYLRYANLSNLSFSYDEYFHVFGAESSLKNGKPILPNGDYYGRSLLLTYIISGIFYLIGVNEFAARLTSVFFGTMSIPLIYLMGSKLFGQRVGIISAVLLTFTPWAIDYSRVARMYPLLLFFYLLVAYFFYLGFENSRKEESSIMVSGASQKETGTEDSLDIRDINFTYLLLSGIIIAICLHLQIVALTFIPSIVLYSLIMFIRSRPTWILQVFYNKYFVLLVISTILALGLSFAIFFGLLSSQLPQDTFLFHWDQPGYWVVWTFIRNYQLLGSALFATIGLLVLLQRGKRGIYVLAMFLVPLFFFIFLTSPSWVGSRFIFHLLPFYILTMAVGIEAVLRQAGKLMGSVLAASKRLNSVLKNDDFERIAPKLQIAVLVLILLIAVPIRESLMIQGLPHGFRPMQIYQPNFRKAGQYIKARGGPRDVVVTPSIHSAMYYTGKKRNKIFVLRYPNCNDLNSFIKIAKKYKRGWIMSDYRFFSSSKATSTGGIPEVWRFVHKNFIQHSQALDGTMIVYEWNTDRQWDSSLAPLDIEEQVRPWKSYLQLFLEHATKLESDYWNWEGNSQFPAVVEDWIRKQ